MGHVPLEAYAYTPISVYVYLQWEVVDTNSEHIFPSQPVVKLWGERGGTPRARERRSPSVLVGERRSPSLHDRWGWTQEETVQAFREFVDNGGRRLPDGLKALRCAGRMHRWLHEQDTDSDQEHAGGRYTVIPDVSISMWTADIGVQARTVREVLAVQARRVCWWHQN